MPKNIYRKGKSVYSKKPFPKSYGLNYSASILVPSTKRDKNVSDSQFKKRIKETKNFLNNSFGGTTTIRSVGSFTDQNGAIVNEKIAVVTSHTDKFGYGKGNQKVKSFLVKKRKEWNQESMGYTFESPQRPSKSFHFV